MSYSVSWVPSAENRLAELWVGSRIAAQITTAADRLDTVLSENPLTAGESRSANLRIAFEAPLAIIFHVDKPAKKVPILDVWTI